MKSPLPVVLSLAVLLAGCATQQPDQPASNQTRYLKPLTSPGAKFGALPAVVQRTVLAEVGPEEIVDAVRDTSSGRVVYKIYFRDSEIFPTLFVAPDGSVLNPNLTVAVSAQEGTRVKPADVPATVKKAVAERASAGEVAYVNKESWGGRVVYRVTFKDEAHNPKLLVGEDGTFLDETE
jgi:ABC-type Fe3+-hydroxamate transport system substrate-binding protein